MILVIDGYNVLRSHTKGAKITDQLKNQFIRSLHIYARKRKHKIVLVFDGGGYAYPSKEKIRNIDVVYSGYKETADDYIKQYIREHKNKDLLLISSDRAVRDYAKRYLVESVGGYTFYQIMIKRLAEPNNSSVDVFAVEVAEGKADLDTLMEQASVIIPEKPEEEPIKKRKKGTSYTLSKEEKKILEKLKKL